MHGNVAASNIDDLSRKLRFVERHLRRGNGVGEKKLDACLESFCYNSVLNGKLSIFVSALPELRLN